jgi:DnaJ-class molecular chaperone
MNFYDILGIQTSSTQTEIRTAYKNLAKKYHPDKNSDKNASEKFKDINIAHDVLSDNDKRKKYDMMSSIDKFKFYDIFKKTMDEIGPVGKDILNILINFFYKDENLLKNDINDLNLNNIITKIKNKINNTPLFDVPVENRYMKKLKHPHIKLSVKTSLEDKYMNKCKKIVYSTNNKEDSISIPLYESLLIFPQKGNYYNETNRGNLIIKIITSDNDKYKIMNEHDIVMFENITLYDYLFGGDINIVLPNNNKLNVKYDSFINNIPIITLNDKGMPYNNIMSNDEYINIDLDKTNMKRGKLHIYISISDIDKSKDMIKDIFS